MSKYVLGARGKSHVRKFGILSNEEADVCASGNVPPNSLGPLCLKKKINKIRRKKNRKNGHACRPNEMIVRQPDSETIIFSPSPLLPSGKRGSKLFAVWLLSNFDGSAVVRNPTSIPDLPLRIPSWLNVVKILMHIHSRLWINAPKIEITSTHIF